MAVQLMPESAVCLLMVSLTGLTYFLSLSTVCLCFSLSLLWLSPSLSSHASKAVILLEEMLPVCSSPLLRPKNPLITFCWGSGGAL